MESGMSNLRTARCLRHVTALLIGAAFAIGVGGCATSKSAKSQASAKPPAGDTAVAQNDKPKDEIQQVGYDGKKDTLNTAPPEVLGSPSVIRARVNNIPVLDEDVRAAALNATHSRELWDLPEEERALAMREIYAKALQDIIDRELVICALNDRFGKQKPQFLKQLEGDARKEFNKNLKEIKKQIKVKDDEELRKFFMSQGTTLENYRRNVERNFMMMEYLRGMIYPVIKNSIGHREIQEYYEQHGPDFDTVDNVVWQDIFIDTSKFPTPQAAKQQAEEIRGRAQKGEDFVKLVKEFDQGDSNYRAGEGTGHRRGEIRPADVETALFQLKSKEVGPVVPVATGFHVVRVVKREYTGRKPLDDDLQIEVRRRLQNEMANQEQRRILLELRRKATIEVIGADGR
jgi:parvulin-like peptidyl-prolyl isomerase